MRMPEPPGGTLEGRLRVRGCLPVRPSMQLQALLSGGYRAAYCALEPGPTAGPGSVRGLTSKIYPTKVKLMHNHSGLLVVAGSVCLTITLLLSWCLVGVRSSAFMKRLFPGYQNLLKAHMDYLLMSGLLMIFYLLFSQFQVSAPPVILLAMAIGSLMNPVGFLALAIQPNTKQSPASPFGALMAGSFTLTTIGYAGAAWSVAHAAVLAL